MDTSVSAFDYDVDQLGWVSVIDAKNISQGEASQGINSGQLLFPG